MVKIIENCCDENYLDTIGNVAMNTDAWTLRYPSGMIDYCNIGTKFPKLEIVNSSRVKEPFLAGLAMGLLLQIYETAGEGLFIPNIIWCAVSIKDKHRLDDTHTDFGADVGLIKILGILNTNWKKEWGGGFIHDGVSTYAKPTSFWIFDAAVPHSADKILTNEKRLAIDFVVLKPPTDGDEETKTSTINKEHASDVSPQKLLKNEN